MIRIRGNHSITEFLQEMKPVKFSISVYITAVNIMKFSKKMLKMIIWI